MFDAVFNAVYTARENRARNISVRHNRARLHSSADAANIAQRLVLNIDANAANLYDVVFDRVWGALIDDIPAGDAFQAARSAALAVDQTKPITLACPDCGDEASFFYLSYSDQYPNVVVDFQDFRDHGVPKRTDLWFQQKEDPFRDLARSLPNSYDRRCTICLYPLGTNEEDLESIDNMNLTSCAIKCNPGGQSFHKYHYFHTGCLLRIHNERINYFRSFGAFEAVLGAFRNLACPLCRNVYHEVYTASAWRKRMYFGPSETIPYRMPLIARLNPVVPPAGRSVIPGDDENEGGTAIWRGRANEGGNENEGEIPIVLQT